MSVIIQGTQLRGIALGTLVSEPAAVLPATTNANIFTVTGGRIVITGLIGTCTTVCSATATTVSVGVAPTVGTAEVAGLCSATAVTSAEVGTLVSLPITKGALLVGTSVHAGGAVQVQGSGGYVVPAGSITITTSATNTGAFKWDLLYVPLDTGATVAAA